ncbi:helix-turn-helix transcriptional regulator [Sanguibacter suarezii]|uniref:helix-turn-helix transcriptional regulator n=1 Tax=Sanguibacter suarezii TaxID=60921 RepID=UPI00082AC85C|nr:WYL domain-containing protein [Sanguibacter suarezii]
MNRTDRLYAIREELRRSGARGRTAEQLSDTFEVSARTIKRDISALQQGGFPVWARLGRTGGYVVDAGATLPPVNITATEAAALAAALASHSGQPFHRDGHAALTKILAVMDAGARSRADQLARRIWVDDDSSSDGTARVRSAIEAALGDRRVLLLRYRDGSGATTSRHVDPQLLARAHGTWYLIAWCRLREGVRWFRLDRIETASPTVATACEVELEEIGRPPERARDLSSYTQSS